MKRRLMIEVDTESDRDKIAVGPIPFHPGDKIEADPLIDMGVIAEALCLMIKICHNNGIKDESESIRDCISHLKQGFIDETYKAHTKSVEHP